MDREDEDRGRQPEQQDGALKSGLGEFSATAPLCLIQHMDYMWEEKEGVLGQWNDEAIVCY